MLFPVILSGGIGSRLWPLSQPQLPKQFLPLNGQHSILQETVLRLKDFQDIAPITYVCNQTHQLLIQSQLEQIDAQPHIIIIEPEAKNTAPAIASAAFYLEHVPDDPLMMVLPSDHIIQDKDAFYRYIQQGADLAREGYLVSLGITPDRPHTGYGYIRPGQEIAGFEDAFMVDRFVEKPDLATATSYVQEGRYLWNSGILIFRPSVFLEELKHFAPGIFTACQQAVQHSKQRPYQHILDPAAFSACPSGPVDVEIMEKTKRAAVIQVNMGWCDVGSWSSLWEISPKDQQGNVANRKVFFKNAENCYVNAEKELVVVMGVNDLIIIDTGNALLIAHKENEADIREMSKVVQKTSISQE